MRPAPAMLPSLKTWHLNMKDNIKRKDWSKTRGIRIKLMPLVQRKNQPWRCLWRRNICTPAGYCWQMGCWSSKETFCLIQQCSSMLFIIIFSDFHNATAAICFLKNDLQWHAEKCPICIVHFNAWMPPLCVKAPTNRAAAVQQSKYGEGRDQGCGPIFIWIQQIVGKKT